MESCARFLPLQLKVAIYRPYGATFDIISLVKQKTRLQSRKLSDVYVDDWIATRVYVAAAIKRVIVTGCVPLKAETVAGPGWKKNSLGFSQ
ncbi:unnamed protein product, partial [Heterotrigona itama]